ALYLASGYPAEPEPAGLPADSLASRIGPPESPLRIASGRRGSLESAGGGACPSGGRSLSAARTRAAQAARERKREARCNWRVYGTSGSLRTGWPSGY